MNSTQFLTKRWRNVLLLFIVFLLIVFIQDLVREVYIFNQETNMIRDELNRDIRNEVQANVESIVDGINSTINKIDQDLIDHTEENLSGLIFAASSMVKMNPSYTDAEIKSSLKELTHEYSIVDEIHNYYV